MCLATNHRKSNMAPLALRVPTTSKVNRRRSRPVTPSSSPVLMVHHNYHDRANELPTLEQLIAAPEPVRESSPFPLKLHDMLDHLEQEADNNRGIISWQPHGRCFVIHQAKALTEHLLPRYKNFFSKITKIASFQRQLNLYGFQRITQGPDKGAYYHECFLRGKPHLLAQLQRIKVKGTGVRAKSNPEEEPNFYSMEWVAPSIMAADTSSSSVIATTTTTMPKPVSSSSLESQVAKTEEQPPQYVDDCVKLSEWGQSFYALDSLPEYNDAVVSSSSSSSLEDALDEDQVLQSMLAQVEDEEGSMGEEFDELLEHVVSWSATPMVAL
mmetsp:Transcript_13551/g.30763  ORF Transcript_13551/g.30763 Transcript_13551/m.30763 type:complete len:326 (+) Transcript_13551:1179-2156(+)